MKNYIIAITSYVLDSYIHFLLSVYYIFVIFFWANSLAKILELANQILFLLAPKLYNHDSSLLIFAWGKSEATKTSIDVRILLKDHDSSRICSDVPLYVDKNVEFIVDTKRLLHWKNVHCDLSWFVRTKTKKYYYNSNPQTSILTNPSTMT